MTHFTKPLLTLTATDIMSPDVVMIPREMSMQGAARILARAGVTGAPVVDADGYCIGVLSATDFMHCVGKDQQAGQHQEYVQPICSAWQIPEDSIDPTFCVEDFATKDPVLVPPGTHIGELARIMLDAHIHRVIVIDNISQRPIGIVSSFDVLAAVARADSVAPESVVMAGTERYHNGYDESMPNPKGDGP